ncbi:pickpocket protein 28-like [Galleria mellonella]|uniref:Pickpocket protein 28-like n=1 Tax=Galleria mellonella TaxID=7137 RepID=A0A6J1WE06_GALME|nr:pickpocket protein 28-like [Galleria mellonella]
MYAIGHSVEVENVTNLYFRDYYLKDFKYIGHEALRGNSGNVYKNANKLKGKGGAVTCQSLWKIWGREVLRGVKQFFYDGSLHGVRYIFEPTFSRKERAAWILIVIISVAICAVNIIQLVLKWTSTPFVNVLDSLPTPIWAVPFPTVILCPHLHVKLSFANVSNLEGLDQLFASFVCPRLSSNKNISQHQLSPNENALLQNFIDKGSLKCTDIIKKCNWPAKHYINWVGRECCDELFRPIFTEYGLCYAFNSLALNGMTNDTLEWHKTFDNRATATKIKWNLDGGYPLMFPPDPKLQPLRVMVAGEAYGLGVELFLNNSEHQYACDGNSLGFTVLIRSPTDHAYTTTVLRLPMDKMTTIEVSPITYKTDTALRNLHPELRQCYFQNERKLEHFHFYTATNCKIDFYIQEAKLRCNCSLYYWPRKNIRDRICSTPIDYECVYKVKDIVTEQQIFAYYDDCEEGKASKSSTTSCHPSCNEVMYGCQVFYSDLVKEPGDITPSWGKPIKGELTQINVHFYEDMFLGQHRHTQYDDYYFVGAIGGLLSLFLGFSIISVAELLYFVLLRPLYMILKKNY